MIDPDQVCEIHDYSADTIAAQISRLLVSRAAEHLIYRECELDEIWRLVDLEIASLRATGASSADAARLAAIRDIIMQAHDLVGVAGDPAGAAECLRELID